MNKTHTLSVRLTEDEYQALRRLQDRLRCVWLPQVSPSEVVRSLIREAAYKLDKAQNEGATCKDSSTSTSGRN